MKKGEFNKSILVLIIFLFNFSACNFAPGSYPNAEKYEVNVKESILIEAIQCFKKNNPQYSVPAQMQIHDCRNDENDHWYHVYFYYPEENQLVNTWTQSSGEGNTTFAFVSINQGLVLGKWKEINRDFSSSENNNNKQKFEERILNKIKQSLK